ncbi:MAG: glycosyltransferase family A protein [Acidobacteriota bacterium]
MTEPVKVSLVVPVGGAAPAWPRSARSLAHLDPPPHELIVVIDGVVDDNAHPSDAAPDSSRILQLDERGGPARARNRGAAEATGEVLLFLDADIEAPPDLIERVQNAFAGLEAPDAVLGSYDDTPSDASWVSQFRNLLHHYVHQTSHETASTFWSGCGAVRREAFLEVDGFDEGYGDPSIEDIELGARLIRSGRRIRLVRHLQVKHLKRWTFRSMVHTDLFKRAIPWTEQMLSSGGLVDDLNVKPRYRISVAFAFLLLAALPLSVAFRPARWLAAAIGGGIVALNAGLFGLFRRIHGSLFALASLPLYWVYLLICGLGFGLGSLRFFAGRHTSKPTS